MRLPWRPREPVPDVTCYRCVRKFSRRRPQVTTPAFTMARDRVFLAGPLCRRCFIALPDARARFAYYPDYVRDRRLALIEEGLDLSSFDPRELDAFRFAAQAGLMSAEAVTG